VDGIALTTMLERCIVPPYGLQGGAHGAPFRVILEHADGTRETLPGKVNRRLRKGDVVIIESCGGGGYGPPADLIPPRPGQSAP
jgi:N-methylhydantoinase B